MTLLNRKASKTERLANQLLAKAELKQIIGGVEEDKGGIVLK